LHKIRTNREENRMNVFKLSRLLEIEQQNNQRENVADNDKNLLRKITENFVGLLIGDKGYISAINDELLKREVNLVAKPHKNMKPLKHIPQVEYYMKHRGLVETVNGLLKEKGNIQHTRHRCSVNFEVKGLFTQLWHGLVK
jgi:Transposase DDE domain